MILLTGGAGFIGSNILRELNNRGVKDVVVADDLTDGRKCRNLAGQQFIAYVDKADLLKPSIWRGKNSLGEVAGIIHMGANTSTTEMDGQKMLEENMLVGRDLMAKCPTDGRFIYASSAAVYGDRPPGKGEHPINPYGFSKWIFDQGVRAGLKANPDQQIAGLRFFNVYGPGEEHKDQMISFPYQAWLCQQLHSPVRVFAGSDKFRRDFVYVKDVAKIVVDRLLGTEFTPGIYDVGTGVSRSFLDVAHLIAGKHPQEAPFPFNLRGRYQEHTQAQLPMFRCPTSLEEGLKQASKLWKVHT